MKNAVLCLTAAALAAACASTSPQQVAANATGCSAIQSLHAANAGMLNLAGDRAIGSASTTCGAAWGEKDLSPAALHERASREARARRTPAYY
ncbi:MAG: hypothetical protein R3C46_06865 [Hyphomonadaceae bacterium]